MSWQIDIKQYHPRNKQEEQDKKSILFYADSFPDTILARENTIAHITSSGFIVNPQGDKILMVFHNIYGSWAWTGGHADRNPNLLEVAIKEAKEETGITKVTPLEPGIASLDILPVWGHNKNGKYVSSHLHLSVAYLLVADETQPLSICEGENTAAEWFPEEFICEKHFQTHDLVLYSKLLDRAKQLL